MLSIFGKETTKLKNKSLNSALLTLSDGSLKILVHVLDQLETNSLYSDEKIATLDARGIYVEHDKNECKPFATKDVKELLKSGLVTEHIESNNGTSFMTANTDVMYATAEIGLFTVIDLVP